MSKLEVQSHLADWQEKEALAEEMIAYIGRLFRKNRVITSIFGRSIINHSVINMLKSHRYVRQIEGHDLHPRATLAMLKGLDQLNLGSCHVDIGRLAIQFQEQAAGLTLDAFLRQQMSVMVDGFKDESELEAPRDVVLYGFGRIGRLLTRILIEKNGGSPLRLRAIVVRKGKADNDLFKRASLLNHDSVHGAFKGDLTIDEENSALIANGNYIKVIYANSPSDVDYTAYGIENALLIDNTGVWRDEAGLGQHLDCAGIDKVILTAPGKGALKNIVYGINHDMILDSDRIISAASCTTNAITPVLKVLNDQYGIENGHVETVHSYTNDQNLIDNYHKGDRRGRSAALNMVLTETGAASAVAKALPELAGKLTGNAIRVPTPNVSMAILNLNLKTETTTDELNNFLRETALFSSLSKQIDYVSSAELVSSDFVGNRHAGIVDSLATIVNGSRLVLYVWYDNEAGYSAQVVRLVQKMGGIQYVSYPTVS